METEYNWYKAHQNVTSKIPTGAKRINDHLGYISEPPYEHVEEYDLRYVDKCTMDELFDRYF